MQTDASSNSISILFLIKRHYPLTGKHILDKRSGGGKGTWTSGITAKRAATLSDDFSHSLHSKLWAGMSPYLDKYKGEVENHHNQRK